MGRPRQVTILVRGQMACIIAERNPYVPGEFQPLAASAPLRTTIREPACR